MREVLWMAVGLIALIGLFSGVLLLLARRRAFRIHRRMQLVYRQMIDRHGLNILTRDYLLRRIIAVDADKGMLVFIDCSGEEDEVQLIDTARIASAQTAYSGNGLREIRNGIAIADEPEGQIGLSLLLNDDNEIYLKLYSEEADGPDEREIIAQKAEKWRRILASGNSS